MEMPYQIDSRCTDCSRHNLKRKMYHVHICACLRTYTCIIYSCMLCVRVCLCMHERLHVAPNSINIMSCHLFVFHLLIIQIFMYWITISEFPSDICSEFCGDGCKNWDLSTVLWFEIRSEWLCRINSSVIQRNLARPMIMFHRFMSINN